MKEPGVWAGRGGERLGFRGPVERSQFVALLRNEHPTSGKRLTARMNTSRQENGETVSNRQVGCGLVFGVPKSLSVYLAITGDRVVENIARSDPHWHVHCFLHNATFDPKGWYVSLSRARATPCPG